MVTIADKTCNNLLAKEHVVSARRKLHELIRQRFDPRYGQW
jgi:hypothetical protein